MRCLRRCANTSNIIYRSGGSFNQLGGLVKPDKMLVNNGLYAMSSGTFSSSDVELPGVSSAFEYAANAGFLQTGGTNNTAFLSIGNWRPHFSMRHPQAATHYPMAF